MVKFNIQNFPLSRIATIDMGSIGKLKHHIVVMLELDVTSLKEKIAIHNKTTKSKTSFTAALIHIISKTIDQHKEVASFLWNKKKQIVFQNINIAMIVEKEVDGQKVPIPLVIEKANQKHSFEILKELEVAKNQILTKEDMVLHRKSNSIEKLYTKLPGFLRRYFWYYMGNHPKYAYKKMGNVAFTSIGMMGSLRGWFIPISVHPICFGISSVIKKPLVRQEKIEIREILNMTVLIDHDVVDGAPIARFLTDLTENIENIRVLN
ncbi:MAG: 2-oxo acid dehydrogenase subunit E2 [Bacteroidetes bacterium]|nr:2-oxo acid dehydrogenase subunit E2 [Bacteroidota bacterium]